MMAIDAHDLPVPTELEVLANLLLGEDVPARELPASTGAGGRAALEAVIASSLAHPPCIVSFSGGRDSSAVLAVAVHVARREGLPEPIPVTMRFPGQAGTDETEWQDVVVRHLGVRDRVVVTLDDELDALGRVATEQVARRGVRWPCNVHMHQPVLEVATGGSAVTGVGGDELFDTRASRHVLVARRAERPQPRDLASLALDVAPRPLRAAVWRRRHAPHFPWLTPTGRARVDRALASDAVAWPHHWDAALRTWYRTRAFRAVRGALPALAADLDVALVNPFVAPTFLAELVQDAGATGFASRSAAMVALFGDLLPASLLGRRTKAIFTHSLCGPATRAFAQEWTGAGVDPRAVDIEALRREWLSASPNVNSILLLHQAWLASRAP